MTSEAQLNRSTGRCLTKLRGFHLIMALLLAGFAAGAQSAHAAGSFTISWQVPQSEISFVAGSCETVPYTITLSGGFNAQINVSASSSEPGLTGVLDPNIANAIDVCATTSVPSGSYPITLTGTGGGLTNSSTWSPFVNNFTLSVSPATVTISPGSSGTSTITVSEANGPGTPSVNLSATGQPSGVTVSFSSSILMPTGSTTMTIKVAAGTAAGTYPITVTGTMNDGGPTYTKVVMLTVPVVGSFTISWQLPESDAGIYAGTCQAVGYALTPSGGFNGSVTVSVSISEPGLTATVNSSSETISVCATTAVPAGSYALTLTGTAGGLTETATWSPFIYNFTISASPTYVTVPPGSSGTSTITVLDPPNQSEPTVNLAATGQPSGVTVSFSSPSLSANPNPVTSTMTIKVASNATTGPYPITITGTMNNGGPAHSVTVNLIVGLPAPTHLTLTVSPGQTVSYTTTLQLTGTISSNISGSVTPTGAVSFYDSGTSLGSIYVTGGQATLSVGGLAAGPHSFSAVYSGDGNFSTSSASIWPGTVTVDATTATVLPPWGDITTVAGVGSCHDYNGSNIPAIDACFEPWAVAADQNGNFYFTDSWNSAVYKVTGSTGIITTIAGQPSPGNSGYNGDGIPASSALVAAPKGIAVDADGNIYISDTGNSRIRVVYSAGTIPNVSNPVVGDIYTIAGTSSAGFNGDGQSATTARLNAPGGISVDANGNIYISDSFNNRIRVVYSSGTIPNVSNPVPGYIYTLAGTTSAGFNGDGQSAINANLDINCAGQGSGWIEFAGGGVTVDGYGNVYFADSCNFRVRAVYSGGALPNVVNPSVGYIYTLAGTSQDGFNGDGQSGIVTALSRTSGVAVDGGGNVYIGDFDNQRVREVYSTGAIPNVSSPAVGDVYTVAGTGASGYNQDNIPAYTAKLNYPSGLALDATGNLYIGDGSNYRIRAVGGQLTAGIVAPLYKVFSILYSPPGNTSNQTYGTTTTNSTTTTVGSSFQQSYQIGFNSSGTADGLTLGGGGTITFAHTTGNSYAFTTTVTDATSLQSGDNKNTTFNPTSSNEDNHNLDAFEIWLNPLITVYLNGTTPVSYSVSSIPLTIDGVPLPAADIVGVPAITMEAAPAGVTTLNPSGTAGVSTVPLPLLEPLPISQDQQFNGPAYIPGLGAICANNTLYQQQLTADRDNPANPAQICTQANQCGCTPADFAGILKTNPLLNYNSTTFTANPSAGWTSPLQANNSPASICGLNTVPNTPSNPADCRYVVVPAPNTNTPGTASENAVPLSFLMEGGIQNPGYTYTDGTTSAETLSASNSTTLAINFSIGIPIFTFKTQDQWTWTDTYSIGNANGIADSMSVLLSSSTATCDEYVSFFEDTEFHTFVFEVPPATQTGCY